MVYMVLKYFFGGVDGVAGGMGIKANLSQNCSQS